jgi:phosphopentomutase
MDGACSILEVFDRVLGSLLKHLDFSTSLVLIASDHGNLEDLSTRRHTMNKVPAIVIGSPELREEFGSRLNDLADISAQIVSFLN